MRWVFERIFGDAGRTFADEVRLKPLSILARHAWGPDERLDLFASAEQSAEAIGDFAGPREAEGFRSFCTRARNIYQTLEEPFIRSPQPTPISLAFSSGLKSLGDMWRISPFSTLWSALGDHFHDPRLRQLFGRYATYCGSSPFDAPATLMLVAHVRAGRRVDHRRRHARTGKSVGAGGQGKGAQSSLMVLRSRRSSRIRAESPACGLAPERSSKQRTLSSTRIRRPLRRGFSDGPWRRPFRNFGGISVRCPRHMGHVSKNQRLSSCAPQRFLLE